jgi:hypothetical protein
VLFYCGKRGKGEREENRKIFGEKKEKKNISKMFYLLVFLFFLEDADGLRNDRRRK